MERQCTCGAILTNPKAKFCSGACKMRFHRGATPLVPVLEVSKGTPAWQDLYDRCDGCNGVNCASGFVPNKLTT